MATSVSTNPQVEYALDLPDAGMVSRPLPGPRAPLPDVALEDFLTRFTLVAQTSFSSAGDEPVEKHSFDPWYQWAYLASVASKLKNYTYMRAELEIKAVVTCSPAMYGIVDVALIPAYGLGANAGYGQQSPYHSRVGRYATIDLSLSNSVTFSVPWLSGYDYGAIDDAVSASSWKVKTYTYHPLSSGIKDGETNVSISYYARVKPGYKLAVLRYQSAKSPSSVREVASRVGAAFGEGLASYFGFSREMVPLKVVGVRPSMMDNPAGVEVKDHSAPLALVGAGMLSDSYREDVGGSGEDLLAFSSLAARPTFLTGFSVTKASTGGTNLITIPVYPGFFSAEGIQTDELRLPTVAHIGLPFKMWRGTMVYDVEICAPTTSRAVIQVFWTPSTPATTDPSSWSTYATINATGHQRHRIKVGWADPMPFKRCIFAPTSLAASSTFHTLGCNGFLTFRLVNPCECVNVDADIYSRIWVSGGEDIEFAVPASTVLLYDRSAPTGPKELDIKRFHYYQSKKAGDGPLGGDTSDLAAEEHVLLAPAPKMAEMVYPGQSVGSARAMVQKPTSYKIWRANKDFGATVGWPRLIPSDGASSQYGLRVWDIRGPQCLDQELYWGDGSTGTDMRGFNYAAWYLRMFTGWAGSQHFSYASPAPQAVAFSIIPGQSNGSAGWRADGGVYGIPGAAVQHTADQGAVSFHVPFSSDQKFYTNGPHDDTDSSMTGTCLTMTIGLAASPGATNNTIASVAEATGRGVYYHCVGEDVQVFEFKQPPLTRIAAGATLRTPQLFGYTNS